MSNLMIAYPNYCDGLATISSGDWLATLPASNLLTRPLAEPARSDGLDVSATKFDVDLDSDRIVRVLCVCRHNLSSNSTYRLRGSNNADMSAPVYDSGWINVWGAAFDSLSLEWEDDEFWSGLPSDISLQYLPHNLLTILPAPLRAQYWRWEFYDAGNTDGWVQAARLFIGDAWTPTHNISWGSKRAINTATRVQTSMSGGEFFDRREPWRSESFALDWLTDQEAFQRVFDLQFRQGIDGEVYFIPDPDDTVNMPRRAFLGRLQQINPIEQPSLIRHATAMTIKELIP